MKVKILHLGKRIISHELVSGSSLIFLGTMTANFFAFLFNLFLVRNLSIGDYGEYAALISLITLTSIPAQSFVPVLVQFSSQFFTRREESELKELYFQSSRFFIILSVLILSGFIIFSSFIHQFFHIQSQVAILISGFIVSVMYLGIPNGTLLQAMLRFGFLSSATALGGFLKLTLGVTFIFLGWRMVGALGAVLISFIIPFIITYIPLGKFISFKKQKGTKLFFGEIFKYAFPSALSVFALSAFTSTDVLLVKHFFSARDAGLYSGLSLAGRIIFYFTAPITSVMFPLVIRRFEEGRNFVGLLYAALLLILVPSLIITGFYFLFPKIAITFFLGGSRYFEISPYLGLYGIYLSLFSLVNVFMNFFLSLKKTKVVAMLVACSFLQAVVINLVHKTFLGVILVSLSVVFLLFALLLVYYFKSYGTKKVA